MLKPIEFKLLKKTLYTFDFFKIIICLLLSIIFFNNREISSNFNGLPEAMGLGMIVTSSALFCFGIIYQIKSKMYWGVIILIALIAMNSYIWMLPLPQSIDDVSRPQWMVAFIVSINMFFSTVSIIKKSK